MSYGPELIQTAEAICSCLTPDQLKALEASSGKMSMNFKRQILAKFSDQFPICYTYEETKKQAREVIKAFMPYFKLKDDDCGINWVLLSRFQNTLFEKQKGYLENIDKEILEAAKNQKTKKTGFCLFRFK